MLIQHNNKKFYINILYNKYICHLSLLDDLYIKYKELERIYFWKCKSYWFQEKFPQNELNEFYKELKKIINHA